MLVYNGEVYNHPELRAELAHEGRRFATTCDTEVVLRLLERDGRRRARSAQRPVRVRLVAARRGAG